MLHEKDREIMKKDIPKQENEIKQVEDKLIYLSEVSHSSIMFVLMHLLPSALTLVKCKILFNNF